MPANNQRAQPWKAFCDPAVEGHRSFIEAQPMVDVSAAQDDTARKYAGENNDVIRKYAAENN